VQPLLDELLTRIALARATSPVEIELLFTFVDYVNPQRYANVPR